MIVLVRRRRPVRAWGSDRPPSQAQIRHSRRALERAARTPAARRQHLGCVDKLNNGIGTVHPAAARVTAVRPGFIYTDIHASGGEPNRLDRVKAFVPMKRGGQPEEIAAEPASPVAAMVTLDATIKNVDLDHLGSRS